jgi:hypothetical protein
VLFCEWVSCGGCSCGREDRSRSRFCAYWLINRCSLTASITDLDAIAVRVVLSLVGKIDCSSTNRRVSSIQINNQIIANHISVWRFRLVNNPWGNDLSFICSTVREPSGVDILSSVSSFIIETHISVMMSSLWCSDGSVGRSSPSPTYHHIVDLEIICEAGSDRHRLVKGVNKLLARMSATSIGHLCWIYWRLRVVVAGLRHIELVGLDWLFESKRSFISLIN